MKKFHPDKKLMFSQIPSLLFSPFQIFDDKTKKGDFKSEGYLKSAICDTFSLFDMKLFYDKENFKCEKSLGLDVDKIQKSDIWLEELSGKISDIEDITLEAEKDSVPDFWNESHENELFIPRGIFLKMKSGTKICIAVFYRLKTAQKIVAQIKHEILGEDIDYYETTTDPVEYFETSESSKRTEKPNFLKKVFIIIYSIYRILFFLLVPLILYFCYLIRTKGFFFKMM